MDIIETAQDKMNKTIAVLNRDLIIKFFIEHKVYDRMAINFMLDEYGQPILG